MIEPRVEDRARKMVRLRRLLRPLRIKASSHDRTSAVPRAHCQIFTRTPSSCCHEGLELKSEMALAELRQARERSQEELARTLKVNPPAVAKLERPTLTNCRMKRFFVRQALE